MPQVVHFESDNHPPSLSRHRNPFAAFRRWLEHLCDVPVGYEDETGLHFAPVPSQESIETLSKE